MTEEEREEQEDEELGDWFQVIYNEMTYDPDPSGHVRAWVNLPFVVSDIDYVAHCFVAMDGDAECDSYGAVDGMPLPDADLPMPRSSLSFNQIWPILRLHVVGAGRYHAQQEAK